MSGLRTTNQSHEVFHGFQFRCRSNDQVRAPDVDPNFGPNWFEPQAWPRAAMDPKEYIRVMEHWLSIFLKGPRKPVLGMENDVLRAIRVPTIVIPGNDNTHASANGIAAAHLIPNSILYQLQIEDQDIALLPFSDWEPHEETLATVLSDFMNTVLKKSGSPL